MGDAPIKMADIARLAKVSMSTVSRALSDSPLIPKPKREEIQEIAAQAGYVINQAARSLRMRKTETIAVVFPLGHDAGQLISDPFFIEMFARLADEFTERSYQVLLYRVTKTPDGWLDRIIQSQRQDGVVVVGQSDQDHVIRKAATTYSNMVVWGVQGGDQNYCSVGTDNIAGGRQAVEHLVKLGRKQIAFLGAPELPEIGLRYQGYLNALKSAGLSFNPALSIPAQFSYEAARATAQSLVESGAQFDAIFAVSDVIALAAIQVLRENGIDVPKDVSVIGYDDISIAAQSAPPLTTVKQDLALAAATLADLLFKRLGALEAASVTLQPQLVVRKSCGALAVSV